MKQHITIDQLNELSDKGKKKLIKWWEPKEGDKFLNWDEEVFYGELSSSTEAESYEPDKIYFKGSAGEGKEKNLPLLSTGQMIEFLGWLDITIYAGKQPTRYMRKKYPNKNLDLWIVQDGDYENASRSFNGNCICDALWEAVKEVLEK